MTKLSKLEPFDGDHIRMVVETPRGSVVKLAYDEGKDLKSEIDPRPPLASADGCNRKRAESS